MKNQVDQRTQAETSLKEQNSKLKQEIVDLKARINQLLNHIKELTGKVDQANKKVSESKSHMITLQGAQELQRKESQAHFDSELDSLKQKIDETENKFRVLKKKYKQSKINAEASQEENIQLQREIDRLNDVISQFQQTQQTGGGAINEEAFQLKLIETESLLRKAQDQIKGQSAEIQKLIDQKNNQEGSI